METFQSLGWGSADLDEIRMVLGLDLGVGKVEALSYVE